MKTLNMIKEKIAELEKLSTADKSALAVELGDELSSNRDEIPVTEELLNELDRRFEEYRQHPDQVVTWEEAKASSYCATLSRPIPPFAHPCRSTLSDGARTVARKDLAVPEGLRRR